MHATCGPIARTSSAAATDESTPPDSPQMTRWLPTRCRISATVCSMNDSDLPRPGAAADVVEEVVQDPAAVRRVADFRVKLQAEDRPAAMPDRGDGASFGRRQADEIAVDGLHLVAVAHPDHGVFGHAGKQAVGLLNPAMGPAELAASPPA